MALTVTLTDQSVGGNKRRNKGTIALDNNYPAGGYPVTAQQFGLGVIEFLDMVASQGYSMFWNKITGKVQVFGSPSLTVIGGQAVGNPLQVSAAGVIGKTTAGNIPAFGTPAEVPAGTDVSVVAAANFLVEGV